VIGHEAVNPQLVASQCLHDLEVVQLIPLLQGVKGEWGGGGEEKKECE
jgi:hypothetical protein